VTRSPDSTVAPAGYLALLLHAHLPYVRHPEYDDPLEERWLVEANTECYLPILAMLERRSRRGAAGALTISLSPTLLALWGDPLLRDRYAQRLRSLLELAEKDVARFRGDSRFGPLARLSRDRFATALADYEERYDRDLASAFRAVEASGVVRLVTTAATHGFLPLMDLGRPSWRAQIGVAAREFERWMGHAPEGMWLPECGYANGVEEVLAEFGIRYFVVDSHGLRHACPRPVPGTYAPLRTRSGVFAIGRDDASSRQVWSATDGYPGDPWYREYYRDQGFDLPLEEVRAYLPSGGTRTHVGLKYYRVTDRRREHREPYEPERAAARGLEHADHFVRERAAQARAAAAAIGQPALLAAPYDAELFGHWWYEGPAWLDAVLDRVEGEGSLRAVDCGTALARIPRASEGALHPSSWGAGGYAGVWLAPENDWIYRHLLRAAERMHALARRGEGGDPLRGRLLRQAGRELLLAQASDWAFIMRTGTLVPYAIRRTERHLEHFDRLATMLERGGADGSFLEEAEAAHPLFPTLDPGLFA
jgi:1,4-alpha-glucan branching enzyme